MLPQETVLLIFAGVAGFGLLILAISIFSVAKAIRQLMPTIEDLRNTQQMMGEEHLKIEDKRIEMENRKLELDIKGNRSRLILLKSSNMKLFEEKQELAVGYRLEALGPGKILITKLQIALINRRSPELIKILDIIYNRVIDPNKGSEEEVIVSVKDFSKISLPFVPNFGFIKDSCQVVASVEYEDMYSERYRLDRDILEW